MGKKQASSWAGNSRVGFIPEEQEGGKWLGKMKGLQLRESAWMLYVGRNGGHGLAVVRLCSVC